MGNGCIACSAVAVLVASGAQGSTLGFSSLPGIEGLGFYSGTITWSYLGSGAGTVAFTLENESPSANGGYLTGIAFNVASGLSLTYASGLAGWSGISGVSASPFPDFDYGAAIGGDWLGGGLADQGIAVDDVGTLVFSVTGADALLSGLSASAFLDGSSGYAFAARFRGFEDGGSDKVLGDPPTVPTPSAFAMAATGVLGSIIARRRRK